MNKALENLLHEVEALPDEEQQRIARLVAEEVERARSASQAPSGRWARLADRMEREAPMAGKSEEFLRRVREFRDHFDLRAGPDDE
jgi:hypothetical protein